MRTVRRVAVAKECGVTAIAVQQPVRVDVAELGGIEQARTDQEQFEVFVAQTEADFQAACQVRQAGYGHHLSGSEALASFAQVEALDHAAGTVVLLCRDQVTNEILGTVRIVPGHAACPLAIEGDVPLPHRITAHHRAEVTRLAVMPGAPTLVKLSLMKGVHAYCQAHGVDWLVIAARNEALARNYRRLGFSDLLAPGEKVALSCSGKVPHFVFTMDVQAVRSHWHRTGHRLAGFMLEATTPRAWSAVGGCRPVAPALASPHFAAA
jgi:hypothetical protein